MSGDSPRTLLIVGGPNGSGKSTIIDNSLRGQPREVLVIERGVVTSRVPDLPRWVTDALPHLPK